MRRIIIIGTALAAACGSRRGVCRDAQQLHGEARSARPSRGRRRSRCPIELHRDADGAANATPAIVAAPLVDIKTTIYGMKRRT